MFQLIADRLDLAIDLLTLGQYGLEPAPARDANCTTGTDCRTAAGRPQSRRRGAHEPLYGTRNRPPGRVRSGA